MLKKSIETIKVEVLDYLSIETGIRQSTKIAVAERFCDYVETNDICSFEEDDGNFCHFRYMLDANPVPKRSFHTRLHNIVYSGIPTTIVSMTGLGSQTLDVHEDAHEYIRAWGSTTGLLLKFYTEQEIDDAMKGTKAKVMSDWAPEITGKAGVFIMGKDADLIMIKMKLTS